VALTALDPKTALIVIDLQGGIVGRYPAEITDGVVKNSSTLAEAFRSHGLPVVLVSVDGQPKGRSDVPPHDFGVLPASFTALVPDLNQQPGDILVTKQTRSAFAGTGLLERLKGLGVTQLVVSGIATSAGVESTARDGHAYGFNVTLPVDAMTDSDPAAHEHSISKIFPRLAETGTTEDVIELLDRSH
jgi:nicotinamidase-related amidase